MPIDVHRQLLGYNAWANRQTLDHLARLEETPEAAMRIMRHIVGAESLWLCRVRRVPQEMEVWPDLSITECSSHLDQIAAGFGEVLDSLTTEGLHEPVPYVNSKGEPYSSTPDDMLTHVGLHSSYHRGQIATHLGRAGLEPPYTDYIHCVRNGWIRRG